MSASTPPAPNSTSSVDAADEAGGEAIYSSEGMPPLPTPRAPRLTSFAGDSSEQVDVLESSEPPMDPAEAIKMFAGTKETPPERLARLEKECKELEQHLPKEQVAPLAQQLQGLLNQMGGGGGGGGSIGKDDVVAWMNQQLQQKQRDSSETTKTEKEGTVVYELYGGVAAAGGAPSVKQRLRELEQRVGGVTTASSESLMDRLTEMESKMKRVDAKALEEAGTRAKVIR